MKFYPRTVQTQALAVELNTERSGHWIGVTHWPALNILPPEHIHCPWSLGKASDGQVEMHEAPDFVYPALHIQSVSSLFGNELLGHLVQPLELKIK